MRHASLVVALLCILPLAQAGTPEDPEVEDSVDDGGIAPLDIRRVWVDTNDTLNLTFHLALASELPAPPKPTSACSGADCRFTSLTYRVIFRVEGADGSPLPTIPAYNRSYVAYRHGPDGNLTAPVGTYDDATPGVLQLHGQANVTIAGANVTLRIPRESPAVNMPAGPAPATRIVGLYAYDSPQACTGVEAVGCAPLLKPAAATPPTGGVTAASEWDRAPDQGFANASFPAPRAAAPPQANRTATPAPPAPEPTVAPTPPPQPSPVPFTPAMATTTAPPPATDGAEQGTPALPAATLGAALLALALTLRRRVP